MPSQGGQTIAVDRPRPGLELTSTDDHGFGIPGIPEGAAGGHGDYVHLVQNRDCFLTDQSALLLGMQIVGERLLAAPLHGGVVLRPGVDLLRREMVVNIDGLLRHQRREYGARFGWRFRGKRLPGCGLDPNA